MNRPLLIAGLAAAFTLSAPLHAGSQHEGKKSGGEPAATQMQPEKGAAYGADADAFEYGFQDMDRNQDGYLSREEAREHEELSKQWEKADANHDGKLDQSEFSAFEESEPEDGAAER